MFFFFSINTYYKTFNKKNIIKNDEIYDLNNSDYILSQKKLQSDNNINTDNLANYYYINEYTKRHNNYRDLLSVYIDLFVPPNLPLGGSIDCTLNIKVINSFLKNLNSNKTMNSKIQMCKNENIIVELYLDDDSKDCFDWSAIRNLNDTKSEAYYNNFDSNVLTKNIKVEYGKNTTLDSFNLNFMIRSFSKLKSSPKKVTAFISIPFYNKATNKTEVVKFQKTIEYNDSTI